MAGAWRRGGLRGPWGTGLLAVVTGAAAGCGAIGFFRLTELLTVLFTGHPDHVTADRAANPHLPWLGPYVLLLAPVLGGLLYGPLVHRFARGSRGHGLPEVMLAVARHGGRLDPRVCATRVLASALCIGSGGSVGRAGPITQLGAALGSAFARAAGLAEGRARLLVGCGAAGGIAATFDAPLAGAFFALELILKDFGVEAFGAVVLAGTAAAVLARAALGGTDYLALPDLPAFRIDHGAQLPAFALLGVAAGVVGVVLTRTLYLTEDLCDRLWRGPLWLRPAVGGLLLGALLMALPQLYGVGCPTAEQAVGGGIGPGLLLLLLVGKIAATSLTFGIGGTGGLLAPMLFIGAVFGAACGNLAELVLPGAAAGSGTVGAYAVVGMGALLAGAARAPITAVLLLTEITGGYAVVLPLLIAVVAATLTGRLLARDTIDTLKLRRRGIDPAGLAVPSGGPLAAGTVGAAMESLPAPLPAGTQLADAAWVLGIGGHGALPVLGATGRYLGTVTARTLAQALAEPPDVDGLEPPPTAGQLATYPVLLTPVMPLAEALPALVSAPGAALPVLDPATGRPVGWLTHRAALRALEPEATGAAPAGAR
ncbi:chloride channel protein [Streptomyces gamaensis]|uniref:Chloride channel protein n=1 Tax=Streptomyces gamaensis TaxID=1763542 RepID=A0ABW0ZAR1_9ACTN